MSPSKRSRSADARERSRTDKPLWVALRSDGRKAPDAGDAVVLAAKAGVKLGHQVLVTTDRTVATALAIVLGEPVMGKRRQTQVQALVVGAFEDAPIKLGRARFGRGIRAATKSERAALTPPAPNSKWRFLYDVTAGLELSDDPKLKTREQHSEKFLHAALKARGGVEVDRQVPVPAPSETAAVGKAAKADLVALYDGGRKKRLLVIEGEWTALGGAESAAQAYEYAARIKRKGALARGDVFGLSTTQVKRMPFHAIVVANRIDTECITGQILRVPVMNYIEFVTRLQQGRLHELPEIRLPT